MKAFIKALPSALFPTVLIVGMVILFQFMFYGVQSFEDFFGVAVGKFNLVHYIIVFVVLWVMFALYFKSDYGGG
jgi:uncharacterized membrane protein YdbT with pleckstrin-like domain